VNPQSNSNIGLQCPLGSNPVSVSSSTDGYTYTTYDALSRKAIVTAPDGTKKQACFNGISTVGQTNCWASLAGASVAWEDDADEKGNDWQRSQNAIGQMTHVFEPNGTSPKPSMETDYLYDMLNNLTAVNQWGGAYGSSGARAARAFSYDSLSRLINSENPETGTQIYSYVTSSGSFCAGDVSLPCSRTDARGVTTTYQYDTLNRLWSKSYSSDASGTPWSCYQYGTNFNTSTVANGIGRLLNAWTQSASCGTSSQVLSAPYALSAPITYSATTGPFTMRSILAYDPMGRILSEKQYTPANNIATNTPYAPQYKYDLAGDLVASTDGITPSPTPTTTPPSCTVSAPNWATLTFTSCYDGAGRLQTLASNWADATHPQSLFSASGYAAFGGLTNAIFGSNAVSLNRTYDTRLRITSETDTGSIVGTPTPGSATVTIPGSEQSK
jgi:hypothetical protein